MSKPYKIIFAGTPEFAVPTLQALIDSPHEVCMVYTQPDRPSGRGQKLTASPVKQLAQVYSLPIRQPQTLRDASEQQALAELEADFMIVIAYGLILPKPVLEAPKQGCINVHASLLPRWRGAAPIQRAILAGDRMTGISIMQMEVGLDTGPVWRMTECPIDLTETNQTLQDKLSKMGARALLATLEDIQQGAAHPVPQNEAESNYAAKITKAEAAINWRQTAQQIHQQIRAFNPWPVCFSSLDNEIIRIWQAEPLTIASKAIPGEIIHTGKDGIVVATGNGALRLLSLQLPGGKPLACKDILNAKQHLFMVGKCFE
ncbi:MAG: methionyl-tRNA formyltransferase [Gammaproteobacteria bacterium]|jgi:methionyl-tRNA formyltransferase|nr:methionyl-tRNA formyltransferase [Gammaproteobacteria bacterium]